jgi:hypothetical protein
VPFGGDEVGGKIGTQLLQVVARPASMQPVGGNGDVIGLFDVRQ